jgi:hypothetical protein
MFEAINKRTLGVGGAALLVAVVFTVVLWRSDRLLSRIGSSR